MIRFTTFLKEAPDTAEEEIQRAIESVSYTHLRAHETLR